MFLTRTLRPFGSVQGALAEMDRLRRDMNRLMGAFGTEMERTAPGVFPLVNVVETGDRYQLNAELPGMKPEDMDISVMGRKVTIQGRRKPTEPDEEARYHRKERVFPSFNRVIELPMEIDSEKVTAYCQNGVLTITLPKSEKVMPKQITIHAA